MKGWGVCTLIWYEGVFKCIWKPLLKCIGRREFGCSNISPFSHTVLPEAVLTCHKFAYTVIIEHSIAMYMYCILYHMPWCIATLIVQHWLWMLTLGYGKNCCSFHAHCSWLCSSLTSHSPSASRQLQWSCTEGSKSQRPIYLGWSVCVLDPLRADCILYMLWDLEI